MTCVWPKLADRVVFLHQGKVHFFGTMAEMEKSRDQVVQQFFALDELVFIRTVGEQYNICVMAHIQGFK